MLHVETYPDAGTVVREYDRQGEVIQHSDQNGTVHAYFYDGLGRRTADAVTALPEGLDTAVLRIETTFDVRGLVTQVTSYDAATSGMVVNDVQREYNSFQQLTREYQEHGGPVDGSSRHVDYSYADGSANTIRRRLLGLVGERTFPVMLFRPRRTDLRTLNCSLKGPPVETIMPPQPVSDCPGLAQMPTQANSDKWTLGPAILTDNDIWDVSWRSGDSDAVGKPWMLQARSLIIRTSNGLESAEFLHQ